MSKYIDNELKGLQETKDRLECEKELKIKKQRLRKEIKDLENEKKPLRKVVKGSVKMAKGIKKLWKKIY